MHAFGQWGQAPKILVCHLRSCHSRGTAWGKAGGDQDVVYEWPGVSEASSRLMGQCKPKRQKPSGIPCYQVWGHRLQHGRVDYSPERCKCGDPVHRCRHESQVLEWSRNSGHLVY